MIKASRFIFAPFALGIVGMTSVALAQEPVQLKFSRVVDLTLPIETNMAGIPGFKIYADNPSQVSIIAAMTRSDCSWVPLEINSKNSVGTICQDKPNRSWSQPH